MGSEAKILRVKDVPTPAGTSMPVAWLDLGGRTDVAVPLVRLAEAVGYYRQKVHELVERDPVLSSYRVTVTVTREGMPVKTAFLQRPGVLGVLVKMSAARIQDPAKRERVIAFQRWAFETLDRLLFEGQAPAQPPLFHPAPAVPAPAAPSHAFKGNRELAVRMLTGEVLSPRGELLSYKEIARRTGVPSSTLHGMAHRLGVAHLRSAKRLPPVQPTPDLARLLAQQAQLLLEAARLLATPPPSGVR